MWMIYKYSKYLRFNKLDILFLFGHAGKCFFPDWLVLRHINYVFSRLRAF